MVFVQLNAAMVGITMNVIVIMIPTRIINTFTDLLFRPYTPYICRGRDRLESPQKDPRERRRGDPHTFL